MTFNPYDRRPVAVPHNRRVIRHVPAPAPLRRNEKFVVIRSRKLDDVVALLLLAITTLSVGICMCIGAYRIAERTTGSGLEILLGLAGTGFIVLGGYFAFKASRTWKACAGLDDKLHRQQQAIAGVIQRPSDDKLQLPSSNWLQ